MGQLMRELVISEKPKKSGSPNIDQGPSIGSLHSDRGKCFVEERWWSGLVWSVLSVKNKEMSDSGGGGGGGGRKWWKIAVVVIAAIGVRELSKRYGWDKEGAMKVLGEWSDRMGVWAMPAYVGVHTLTLALCLPYAVFMEATASLIFGFFPAVVCVFSAKVLGASLSFWIGRLVFRSSSSAKEWVQKNKYFHILSKGVERDGWKFVLLARFSPMPSYVINYALAATRVGFLVDFLLPTVIGCLPMIMQNTSIGSLAGAAVASASGSQKSQVWSYLFPALGIISSIFISLRIRKYSTDISLAEVSPSEHVHDSKNDGSSQNLSGELGSEGLKKNQ